MSDLLERNYEIVGLSDRGTLIIRCGGGDPEDSEATAKDWVGGSEALRPGQVFDYFTEAEKKILRRGLRH